MNERIRELRKQVKVDHTKFSNDPKFHEKHVKPLADIFMEGDNAVLNEYMTKFAELIVKECIDCLKPLSQNHSMVGAAQDTIKEHFGVEE